MNDRSAAVPAAVWKFRQQRDPYLSDLPPSSSSALNGRRTCLEGSASKNDASLEEGDHGYLLDDIRVYGVEETVLYPLGMLALVVVLVGAAIKLRRSPREAR